MQTTHWPSLNRELLVECVCVWEGSEGLVAREILTYRAPLLAALSLASTSQRKRFTARLILVPSRLRLFLLSLPRFVRVTVVEFLFVIRTSHCTNHNVPIIMYRS